MGEKVYRPTPSRGPDHPGSSWAGVHSKVEVSVVEGAPSALAVPGQGVAVDLGNVCYDS